jgi:hypothetical protein
MKKETNFIGKHVIVRSNMAGVFFGLLESKSGNSCILRNARKIYNWNGAAAVEEISQHGVAQTSKLTIFVNSIEIFDICQILLCTKKAIDNLTSITIWKIQ